MAQRSWAVVIFPSVVVAACGATVPVRTTPRRLPASILAQPLAAPGSQPLYLYWGGGGRRFAPVSSATHAESTPSRFIACVRQMVDDGLDPRARPVEAAAAS